MPKKKPPSALPPVPGGRPWSKESRGSSRGRGQSRGQSRGLAGKSVADEFGKDGQRHVLWDGGVFKAGSSEPLVNSEPSTAASFSVSRDDARSISQQFDDSLQVEQGFSTAPDTTDHSKAWNIQSPDEIIAEVKRCVHERKPWRKVVDDSVLDHKHNEKQDRLERGFHIILPDNRVRVMEDELSFRVRCSLLDTELVQDPPPPPRRPDKSKLKNQRMRVNPWYLKPTSWYSLKEKLKAEDDEENSNDFPYADVVFNQPQRSEGQQSGGSAQTGAFSTAQKESLDIYKLYVKDLHMKGNRLPNFLQ